MAKLGIDVSQVKSPFTPVPEGNYDLQLKSYEITKSKKGEAMIQTDYEIVGHPELAGRKMRYWMMLEGAGEQGGKFAIHQHCLAVGDDPKDPDPETWVNQVYPAEVTIEETKDRGTQNRIVFLVDVQGHYNEEQAIDEQLEEIQL